MRTAEEVVIGDLDRTIGRIKAMRALAGRNRSMWCITKFM